MPHSGLLPASARILAPVTRGEGSAMITAGFPATHLGEGQDAREIEKVARNEYTITSGATEFINLLAQVDVNGDALTGMTSVKYFEVYCSVGATITVYKGSTNGWELFDGADGFTVPGGCAVSFKAPDPGIPCSPTSSVIRIDANTSDATVTLVVAGH